MTRRVTPYHKIPKFARSFTFTRRDRCMSDWKIAPGDDQICAHCGREMKSGQAWMGTNSEICHVDCEILTYPVEWKREAKND